MFQLSDELDVEIRAFVRAWVKLLAQGRAEEACALLDEPDERGVPWTPDALTAAILDVYGSDPLA